MNRLVWVLVLVELIAGGSVSAHQRAKSGDGSREITGRVLNHDGQPLAGGRVVIYKIDGGHHRDTLTNDTGAFRFDDLSYGVYIVFTQGAEDGEQVEKYHRPGDFVTLQVKRGGVITGTVTDSTGEPVIAARVQIRRVRDASGRRTRASRFGTWQTERSTDDRGVYRFWGLPPGSYLVRAGGRDAFNRNRFSDVIGEDVPTFHPSAATPEAATEVRVDDGVEATGIDIRHRGESGHTISGHISGLGANRLGVPGGSREEGFMVALLLTATGELAGQGGIQAAAGSNSFSFENVADGEYDLSAHHIVVSDRNAMSADIAAASPPRRVIVKSKDVTGVEIKLLPLGSIEGRVVLDAERKRPCQSERITRVDETVIVAGREDADRPVPNLTAFPTGARGVPVVPDQKGDFAIRSLQPARYRLEARLTEHLYIRSISLPGAAKPGRKSGLADAGRDGIAVKSGERVTGLTITLQEGAASVRGRVVMVQDKATLPSRLRVHLVPAEQLQRDDVLRFAEAAVESDGSFVLTNIAPGRYWLLARAPDDLRDDRPLSWDGEVRAKLIREATAANTTIELQPCQRIGGHMLRYAAPATTNPK